MTPRAAWLTTITLLVAMVTYVMAVPLGELVLLLIPVTLVVRWLAYQRTEALAPPWLVAGCTFLAVFYAAYRVLSLGPDVAVLAEFVAVLAVIKSLERWSPRDDLQMLLVAIFLVLAAIIESSTILVGVMLLLFVPLLGFTAMALQIEGALRFGDRDGPHAEKPDRTRSAEASSRAGLASLLGTFAFASAFIFTIAVVAFVLLPRGIGGDSLGGLTRPVIGRATGFRSNVELGRGGLISSDQTVVMEVEIRDRLSTNSLGAFGRIYHLRGTALHTYDNGLWSPEYEEGDVKDFNIRQAGSGYDFRGNSARANLRQIVHLTPSASDGGVLFTVWAPIRIEFADRQPGSISADNATRTAALEDSKTKLTTYEVLSVTQGLPSRMPQLSRRGIVDFDNQTLRDIAYELAEDAGFEPEAALRPIEHDAPLLAHIESWLAESGGFTYTLDVPVADADRDPIEWFLTEARTGHCEYYASAMAALCRCLGIDTRVVTGYMLAEYDPTKQRYIVRRSNAHAWVEAETEPGLWQTFDPTPNASALHVPETGNFRFLRKFLDAVDGFWLSSVVSFDESNQMKLLGIEHIAETGALHDRQLISRGKRILRFVMILLMTGLAGLLIFRWYRKPAHLRASPIPIDLPHAALVVRQRLLAHWATAGRPRPDWLGLTAHADSPAERELAQLLSAAAFGAKPWSPAHTDRARKLLDQLQSAHN